MNIEPRGDARRPVSEFERLQHEINRLFETGLGFPSGNTGLFDRAVSPAVDVIESEDEYWVTCDLPGIERDKVELSLTNNVLTLRGEKHVDPTIEKEGAKTYRRETWSGAFQRTISLPDLVDPDRVTAEMKDGVLTIRLSKREDAKPRRIAIGQDG